MNVNLKEEYRLASEILRNEKIQKFVLTSSGSSHNIILKPKEMEQEYHHYH